jgi:hypothetical protein
MNKTYTTHNSEEETEKRKGENDGAFSINMLVV